MNKLRKKIFWTLLTLLSFFLFTILFIFNFQNYNQEKINIEQNLFRMKDIFNKNHANGEIPKFDGDKILEDPKIEDNNRRFMDITIYTIILNGNNDIVELISHTENGLVGDNVREYALKIVSNNKQNRTYIGNLYFSKFSYKYEENNFITLIDNKDVSDRLLSFLWVSVIIFLFSEFIIIIISKILSTWIIKPVEISFNKQKQFIADASHELKTPLSIIMACAETLESNPKETKWLESIKSESNRMGKLITSLLDLAKVENENCELYEEVNLSRLVEKSILSFESLAYEKNIKLDYEIEDNIFLRCNSEEIGELLNILLDNGVKHSSKEGNIIVNLRTIKNSIILEVINKGEPIPASEEEKIFERFYRVDKSRNRNENRYGLGLAIAKAIVINHCGKIVAFSDNGYTTFKVIFKI